MRAHRCGFLAVAFKTLSFFFLAVLEDKYNKKKIGVMEKKITKTNKVALASDAVNPILCGEFRFEKSNRSRISTFCLTYIVGTPLTFRNTTPSF